MDQVTCIGIIKEKYSTMSKAEKIVADYVMATPHKIVENTISEVADDLHVATSTVFRFCKVLGYKGYQAMKLALASELTQPVMKAVEEKITEFDSERQITEKIFNSTINSFKETMDQLDYNSIKKAVEAIVKADRIEFYGFGNSSLVAMDAHYKFIGSGINTAAYTDFTLQRKAASQLSSKDVAIFLSDESYSDAWSEVLQIAKENGAVTIGMAPLSTASLLHEMDLPMHMASGPITGGGIEEGVFTRLIQLSLIDALYINVIHAKEGFLKSSIKKLKTYLGKPKPQSE